MKTAKRYLITLSHWAFIFFVVLSSSHAYGARSDVEAFVTRFYQQCLSRQPDQPGLDGWTDALLNGSLCGDDVAYGFIFSQEFINRNTSNGSLTAEGTDYSAYVLMNLAARDNLTGKTYLLDNFRISIQDWGYYAAFDISGRYYDHDDGYVTMATPIAFAIMSYSSYPYTGQFIVYGRNGTKARITAINASYCVVDADTDGNGTYDWSSGMLLWSAL